MKLTIDTQTDTYEDIQKVLHILTNIIEKNGSSSSTSIPSTTSSSTDTTNMMSMFSDDSSTSSATQKEIADTPPDFSSFLNLTKSQARRAGEPLTKVEFF